MEKKRLSVEEEFLSYGESSGNGYSNGAKSNAQAASSSSFSKLIQVLIILVLLAVLVVLGIIGYMYAKKAFMTQNQQSPAVQQKVAKVQQPMPVQQQVQAPSKQAPVQTNIASQPSKPKVVTKPTVMAEQKVAQKSEENEKESQELTQALAAHLQKEVMPKQKEVAKKEEKEQSVQTQQVQKTQEASTKEASTKKDLKSMSDEELIEYLKSLKPDQLKNLDIEKLILSRKAQKGEQNVKVAKTEYLNNQLVLTQKPVEAKQSETAQLSQKLSSLIQEEEKQAPQDTYVKKLQKEITTRQKTVRYYVVQPGDSLSKIAKEVYGKVSAYVRIYEANQDIITNPNLIYPGQKLRIPSI